MKLRLKPIVRAAAFAVYAVAFGEIFLRLFAPQPILPRYVTAAPWGVRMNTPNSVYRQWTPEVDVQIRINGQGMRADHDFPESKPPNLCRIALLGDSYFIGFEASLEDTFAHLLEAHLRQAGLAVEVLNFAVSGHGTAEMLLTFDGYSRKFAPDLVIAEWHGSDWQDNVRSGLFQLKDGHLRRLAATYLPATKLQAIFLGSPAYRWMAENSQLYNAMRDYTARIVKRLLVAVRGRPKPNGDEGDTDSATPLAAQVGLGIALVEELKRHVEEAGARFVMVDVPRRLNRQHFESSFVQLPAMLTDDPAFISPVSAFEAAAGPETTIYTEKGNSHLTALGNRLLAELVAEKIEADPWADKCKFRVTNTN
jgi:hypothetical protein